MSDNIPFELQEEIIQRVPVKSLLRFRSVSKQWKSAIDSPDFADDYCLRHSQPRLLIRYIPIGQDEQFTSLAAYSRFIGIRPGNDIPKYKYVWVADGDDTFEQHQIPTTTLPKSLNNLKYSRIVGCSHGLVFFYGPNYRDKSPVVVLWNPWIRKFVDVPVPNVPFEPYQTILGFGVSPQTKDPKIFKINNFINPKADNSAPIPWLVEVFTLSSGTWKTPSNNLPCRNSIIFGWSDVALEGVIYWRAFERINVNDRSQHHSLIMSFNLSSERFEEICLPDNLARRSTYSLSIFKRMESVVVLEMDETGTSYDVWLMGQGVTKSFTKIFTIMTLFPPICMLHGFMNNGEPIVDHGSDALFAYDSYTERIKDLGIFGRRESFSLKSYVGTLLLMDQ